MMSNYYLKLGDLSIWIHGEYEFREQQNVTEFQVENCKPDIDICIKKYQSINFDNFRATKTSTPSIRNKMMHIYNKATMTIRKSNNFENIKKRT